MTIKDVPLLRKSLEHITEHPEEWEQDTYGRRVDCGTVGCLAYHIVVLAGHRVIFDNTDDYVFYVRTNYGAIGSIHTVAADELGLRASEAGLLFQAENSLCDVWDLAAEFTGGEIEVPEHVKGQS